jgi:hypothetical protein
MHEHTTNWPALTTGAALSSSVPNQLTDEAMEADAVETLTQEAKLPPGMALALAKAFDLAIAGAELVTLSVFNERMAAIDTRFALTDARMETRFAVTEARVEARFGELQKSMASAKIWALSLYVALLGGLGGEAAWLINRQDQLVAQLESRLDRRFEAIEQHFAQIDRRFERIEQRFEQIDRHFARIEQHLEHVDRRITRLERAEAARQERSNAGQ